MQFHKILCQIANSQQELARKMDAQYDSTHNVIRKIEARIQFLHRELTQLASTKQFSTIGQKETKMKILKDQLNSMITAFSPIQPFHLTLPSIPQPLIVTKSPFNSATFLPLKLMNPKPLPKINKTLQKDKAPIAFLKENQLTNFLKERTTDFNSKFFSEILEQEPPAFMVGEEQSGVYE